MPPSAINEDCEYNDVGNGIMAYELIDRHVDASPTRTGKALHPILPNLTKHQRSRIAFITVAPNLLIVAMPDKVKYWVWLPASRATSFLGVSWAFPESTIACPGFAEHWEEEKEKEKEKEDLQSTAAEYLEGWRRYQVGMESRFAPRGCLSRFEKTVGRLQD